jgi:hypothetical protein
MPGKGRLLEPLWVEVLGRLVRDETTPEPKINSNKRQPNSNKPIRPSTVPMGCASKGKGIKSGKSDNMSPPDKLSINGNGSDTFPQ